MSNAVRYSIKLEMNRAPWYIIAWRCIWVVPLIVFRSFYVATVAIGWGPGTTSEIHRRTL